MLRAAVLIGVAKTGKLPRLNDAIGGAARIKEWALKNDFTAENVHVFTDDTGPVNVVDIQKTIYTLVDSGTVEQLFVYFAGHGVNIGYSEYWLLSGAPLNSAAAVNVEASIARARQCGIPHVVFISDACRTPAATLQAQGIVGSVIFPNSPAAGPEQDVDIFFAATLGRPALELKDMRIAEASHRAIYTDTFLDGLSGKLAGAITPAEGNMLVVRPRPLKESLFNEIPKRFGAMGFAETVAPFPDARITSRDSAWLARFPGTLPPDSDQLKTRGGASHMPSPVERANLGVHELLRQIDTLASPPGYARRGPQKSSFPLPSSPVLNRTWQHANSSMIHIHGGKVVQCLARRAIIDGADTTFRLSLGEDMVDVLLIFADRSSAVIPVMSGHEIHIRMDNGEFVDLIYAASDVGTLPGPPGRDGLLRLVRNAVAAAALTGGFALESRGERQFMDMLNTVGLIDPALVLYAAYAFHRRHGTAPIQELQHLLLAQYGRSLFDMALLVNEGRSSPADVHPPFPLMAQGWSLLAAYEIRIPDKFLPLQHYLMPSLWSHFNQDGTAVLQSDFLNGD